jgi:hypothetical protein
MHQRNRMRVRHPVAVVRLLFVCMGNICPLARVQSAVWI